MTAMTRQETADTGTPDDLKDLLGGLEAGIPTVELGAAASRDRAPGTVVPRAGRTVSAAAGPLPAEKLLAA